MPTEAEIEAVGMMDDIETLTPVYLENTHWPVMRSGDRVRRAADNYGDVECPFCDVVVTPERNLVTVGDKCWRCGAAVVRIAPWGQALECPG